MDYLDEKIRDAKNYDEVYYILKNLPNQKDLFIIKFLEDEKYINKYNIDSNKSLQLLILLSDEKKLCLNPEGMKEEFGLSDSQLDIYYNSIENENKRAIMLEKDEEKRLELMANCILTEHIVNAQADHFSDKNKCRLIIMKDIKDDFSIIYILTSIKEIKYLVDFCIEHKNFLQKRGIELCDIVYKLANDKQMEFLEKVENGEVKTTPREKLHIIASMSKENKKKLEEKYKENPPLEYKRALEMALNSKGVIDVDIEKNLEIYKDWDEMITICPMDLPKEKFKEICKICPNLKIIDESNEKMKSVTLQEYQEAEKWIQSILEKMNMEWSDIQKLAFIDNEIGNKISYSAEYDTEKFDVGEASNMWKAVNSGYGICAAIAKLEVYMLNKIGIEAELISSGIHVYVKIKNIEIPTSDGATIKGDTLIDPTWNLKAAFFGMYPDCFCRSYKEMRKKDIIKKNDYMGHKNDEIGKSAVIDIEEEVLRGIFASIDKASKNGAFRVGILQNICLKIDKKLEGLENVKEKLYVLKTLYPDFTKHQRESEWLISAILENGEYEEKYSKKWYKRCVVNRVYERKDKDQKAVLFVYIDELNTGENFYYCRREDKEFCSISKEDFEKRFECYQMDLEKNKGIRMWEKKKNCGQQPECENKENGIGEFE